MAWSLITSVNEHPNDILHASRLRREVSRRIQLIQRLLSSPDSSFLVRDSVAAVAITNRNHLLTQSVFKVLNHFTWRPGVRKIWKKSVNTRRVVTSWEPTFTPAQVTRAWLVAKSPLGLFRIVFGVSFPILFPFPFRFYSKILSFASGKDSATKWVVNTQSIALDPRDCPGPLTAYL